MAPRGFSLVELMVVLAVTVILTSLLFPAFRTMRDSAQKLASASNQRQIGFAITLYATDHNEYLPHSKFGDPNFAGLKRPQEMMAATVGPYTSDMSGIPKNDWDGLGWLVARSAGPYLDTPAALYSPSHRGDHPYEKYADLFNLDVLPSVETIYTNYQYSGDIQVGETDLSKFENSFQSVLVTDGLRTLKDFNHGDGCNVLHGDCAVTWYADADYGIRNLLPVGAIPVNQQPTRYTEIWDIIKKGSMP